MDVTLNALLAELGKRGIRLQSDGERLLCSAPAGVLTAELQESIRRHKRQLIGLLGIPNAARERFPLLPREPGSPLAPASFGQERLWLLQQMSPESFGYNIPGAVRLSGPLQRQALEAALTEIVRRHEVLRTTLVFQDGQLLQKVHPPVAVQLESMVIQGDDREDLQKRLQAQVTALAQQPFDLDRFPYWRFVLLKLAPEEHVLVLVQHHCISDGWSLGILVTELGKWYEALSVNAEPSLPPLEIQYGDYAAWQRQLLSGETLDALLQWWKSQLTPLPAPLEIPVDYPRPALQSFRGAWESLTLLPSDLNALQQFGQRYGVTPFMILLAAFAALLARYSRQRDLVIGTPVGNRTHPACEPLLGFFLNTLPLRLRLSGDPTFVDLVQQARNVALDAYEHQELPFEKLVEELEPPRDLSRSPVFQTMFIMHTAPRSTLAMRDLTLGEVPFESGTAKYDLTLAAAVHEESALLTLEYNTSLYEAATIRRMLRHYRQLLVAALDQPRTPVMRLSWSTPAERRRVLVDWNQTSSDYPAAGLHELILEQAARTPQQVAVCDAGGEWTYGQLSERIGQLEQWFRNCGIRPGDRVALRLERNIDLVAAILAVHGCGAAYVPVDESWPDERMEYVLRDAQVSAMITASPQRVACERYSLLVCCVDEAGRAAASDRPAEPRRCCHPDQPAYVLYTSGSTGLPKGVCVSHRSIVNLLTSMRVRPGIAADDWLLASTSLTFDISVLELFLPLAAGARLVLAPDDWLRDGQRLAAVLNEQQITIMQATPTMWSLLLRSGWQPLRRCRVLCGGEPLTRGLADQLLHHAAEVWNVYGPTETTVWSTVQQILPGVGRPTIGRPIGNTQAYVLDDNLDPVPIGAVGELYLGGDGLALGYVGRPELTAQAFLPHPFSAVPGARLYRTGDLVRYLGNGQLEHLGRVDRQVKLRGHRIELEEIEHVLTRDQALSLASVRLVGTAPNDYLAAWIVPNDRSTFAVDRLRRELRRNLPEYMVPSRFVVVDELPLTSGGKLDRQRLPSAMPADRSDIAADETVPRTGLERSITDLWRQVLQLEQVGLHANFFDLGGHSLLLATVRDVLQQQLKCEVSMIDLFRYPTVASLAGFLDKKPK